MLRSFLAAVRGASRLKRMPFYAVRVGRQTGIFTTWQECKKQVDGVIARFKKFETKEEADIFMNESNANDHKRIKPFIANSNKKTERPSTSKRKYEEEDPEEQDKRQKTDPSRPVVYTDGCCTQNGRKGAKAGIGVFWGDNDHRNISDPLIGHPTNQRAELGAAIKAVETAQLMNYPAIEIRTDSMYTLNAVTKWMDSWKRNGFHTAKGTDVKNKEDIVKLYNLCQTIDVKWTHIRGHSNVYGNEKADELAKLGSVKPRT